MKRWFVGKFAGHYRGSRQKASGMSPFRDAEHFRIEVYEAVVTQVTLGPVEEEPGAEEPQKGGDSPPTASAPSIARNSHHHTPSGHELHQPHIGQVHLVDALRSGQTVRATVHDALMSGLTFSHGARQGVRSFGRVEGTISGWFRPPPEPSAPAEIAPPSGPAPVGWASDVIETAQPKGSRAREKSSEISRHAPVPAREKISFPPPNRSLTKPGVAPPPPSGVLPPEISEVDDPPLTTRSDSAPESPIAAPSAPPDGAPKLPEEPRDSLYEFADAHEALDDNDVRLMRAYRPTSPSDAPPDLSPDQGDDSPAGSTSPWPVSSPDDADGDEDLDEEEDEALGEPTAEERPPAQEYPFFLLGLGVVIFLAFLARPFAALVFGATFFFAYGARKWLLGVVPDAAFIRFVSLVISAGQVLLGALLIARWSAAGCVALTPLPLMMLLGGQMVSSLFPRPLTFALTAGTFAAVLAQAYGTWAPPLCQ